MRIANLGGRAVLLNGDSTRAVDVERVSGTFTSDPHDVYVHWAEFVTWGAGIDVDGHPDAVDVDRRELSAPVPRPAQVFGIGLNYAEHAAESRMDLPEHPLVFTKFPSSITGPDVTVHLSGDRVDWEAELVVVIGTGGRNISEADAWDAIAGLTVGQDISDRTVQSRGAPAQFNLGKSFAGFGPTGPAVVTLDDVRATADPDALAISCRVSDEDGGEERVLQDGTTGDLIFTGTPSGVGLGRDPQVFLRHGQRLTTEIEGLGAIVQRFVG